VFYGDQAHRPEPRDGRDVVHIPKTSSWASHPHNLSNECSVPEIEHREATLRVMEWGLKGTMSALLIVIFRKWVRIKPGSRKLKNAR
jgi:hypothetical protein